MRIDVKLLFKLWHDRSVTDHEIRMRLGVGKTSLHRLRHRYGLPKRQVGEGRDDCESPTQEEILQRAAEVRATWSPQERRSRIVQKCHGPWEPPSYKFNHRDAVFSG